MPATVTNCYVYPLKSAKAIDVSSLDARTGGLKHDRSWMVVRADGEKKGRFLSQRDAGFEHLALVKTDIETPGDTHFHLPNATEVDVAHKDLLNNHVFVHIWRDRCEALDAGDEAAQVFSALFGQPVRLVHMPEGGGRHVDPDFVKSHHSVGFADAYPILMTNQASLAQLVSHLPQGQTPGMMRFRPNIVLDGLEAFEEDIIHEIKIGEAILECVKPCARCKVINIDQDAGRFINNAMLRTLIKMRSGKSGNLAGAFFGQNAIVQKPGWIHVGDKVDILSRRPLPPVLQNARLRPSGH